jgi:hypothetical protein
MRALRGRLPDGQQRTAALIPAAWLQPEDRRRAHAPAAIFLFAAAQAALACCNITTFQLRSFHDLTHIKRAGRQV